ncbi:DNA-binding transcriptional LysR family regulator [Novosphingobium sp. SG751A]|uniref:LysR family transcriptional regulator n=1 Tax=Novosphingobium sp. SG751A TaxID=2587000 RepID=UPI00155393D9|nr:LysR family transcriptional regulator [Novosphingobium sp. SG751A]NOW45281.1 DNA-binding transcriptional LysR family regulator [Novosphingobium sp. SG751A]
MNDIRQLDFNLLKAFDALLVERSVTRAAHRLSLTQPAVSGMLGRLRVALDDPLFVRSSHGIVPTPRALALAQPLRRMMSEVECMLTRPQFDPASSTASFSIAATDYAQLAVLVPWLEGLRRAAPGIRIAIHSHDDARLMAGFEQGQIDLALVTPEAALPDLHAVRLYEETYSLALREGHPAAERDITLDEFCALDHGLVSLRGDAFLGVVDRALTAMGRERRVSFSASCFLVLVQVLARTDLVATVPTRLLDGVAGLVRRPLPLAVPGFTKLAVWHERSHRDPAHQWLRADLIASIQAGDQEA